MTVPDKARKFLTPSLIVVGGTVFGIVIAMANNMRGWELALGMLITTGCSILIAVAVIFSKPQPIHESERTRKPVGFVVLAVVALVPCVCWVVSPVDGPVSNRHGTAGDVSSDYPDFAQRACQALVDGQADRTVLVCGTGIGMSIAANKIPGIRCAVVTDLYGAKMTRAHNDSNALALRSREQDIETNKEILDVWLNTEFEGGSSLPLGIS